MSVLEKILKEVEEKIKFAEKVMVKPPCDKLDEIANDTAEAFIEAYKECKEIIRSHMDDAENDGWIPVSERLPEPNKIVEVTMHCSEWISDYNSAWVPEDEKKHHEEEYIVNVGYMGEDGYWIVFDDDGCVICCDKEFGTDKGCVYSVVTAWHLKTKPYKGE